MTIHELFVLLKKRIVNFFSQSLFANAGYLLGLNLFPSAIGFLFWGIASRLFNVSDVGLASAVLSAVALLAGISNLGFSTGVIRLLPEAAQPRRLLNTVYSLSLITASGIGGIYLLSLPLWSAEMANYFRGPFFTVGFLLYVVVTSLGSLIRDTYVARRRAQYAFVYTVITQILRLVFLFFSTRLAAAGLIGSNLIAFTIALIYIWVRLPTIQPDYRFKFTLSAEELFVMLPYALGNHLANLIWQLPQTLLPLLIFSSAGAEANAYAYIALMLGSLICSPSFALIGSSFAECANTPEMTEQILAKVTRLSLLLTLLISVILLASAPWVLLIFGKEYSQSASVLLRWLCVAAPFMTLNQIFFNRLRLEKKIRLLIASSTVLAILILGLSAVLLNQIGISAGGIGILLGNILITVLFLNKKLMGTQRGYISTGHGV
ncbi:MAG: oligosaccharide flippase family protein [Anaerolineales bacterium]